MSDDPLLPSQDDEDGKALILPTFQALTAADPVSLRTLVPEQRDLTRLVMKALPAFSPQSLSLAGQHRTLQMGTRAFNALNKESPLIRSHRFKHKQKLKHTPTQFLASTHSMRDKFNVELWQVYAAYALGTPMPKSLQPVDEQGATLPCFCKNKPIPDAAGRHKMTCTQCGKKSGHQHIDDVMRVAAYPACVPFTNSKTHVPTHLDSAKQGDALTTLSSDALAWPHVLDYTMVHPLNTDGSWNLNAVSEAYKNKMRKHDRAYNQQNIAFVPCVVTTYGYLDDDFVRLLYILAMRQAENIIAFHRPEVDFKVILGQCFAGFKGQVGAACARAMAMRALSYNTHGRRVLAALAVSRPQRRDQRLHINEAPIPPVARVHVA